MKQIFIGLGICLVVITMGCGTMQQGPGTLFGGRGGGSYAQQFEILQDVPIVTVKLQSSGNGWKTQITNHADDPLKFLVVESSYESPNGVSSGLVRSGATAEEARIPIVIPANVKHKEHLLCGGQLSLNPNNMAKLNLVFELKGERKTMVIGIRSRRTGWGR